MIIFSRFDQLSKDFDANFLSNIQSLAAQNLTTLSNNIVLIFTAVKPLHELSPEAVSGGNLSFYSKIYYFKPFTSLDLKNLLNLEGVTKAQPNLDKMIKMSGGHNQLLHILLNSQKQQNLLLDQFVRLQLKDLISYLSYQQRKQLQKLAANKNVSEIDEYLSGVGMVSSKGRPASGWEFQIFTPLLTGYIKTNIPVRLPVKEAKLLKLLRNNLGKTVSKDEIFAEVWSGSEEATDWALDALIYRLRKHPFMISNGYIIESHKKVGYTLIQT